MKKYEGRKWGTLTKAEQADLLRFSNAINGIDCENAHGTCDCIIDLTENLSISGELVDDEIVIDDNSVIYNPCN